MQLLRVDWNVVFTIINLIVLYLALKKFLIGPVTGIMQERRRRIAAEFAEADKRQKQAGELKEQYEEILEQAHEMSAQIVEAAKKSAEAEYESRLKAADIQAGKMIANAQKEIELERDKTLKELESQIADLALVAARKVVGGESTGEKDRMLYEQFLAEAGDLDDTDSD